MADSRRFWVYYPTLYVNKFGLQSGESYRAQGRTFCDPNITAYRSPNWTSPIFGLNLVHFQ